MDAHSAHALAAVQRHWNAAALHWDPEALAALYATDALLFGGRPALSVGRLAIRAYFASYADEIASASLALKDQHVLQTRGGDLLAQGYGHFSFVLRQGSRTESRLRTTLLLTSRDDGWLIRQHHFSALPSAPPLGR
ncbi:YybH family protein [Achromobacter xylosoxidans]|uniref:YybH family protein n=2 Tax=Alcaligenes xylosoxydans xylosoxydans TaxID=85698 RepID=UPI00066964B0|nr:SgcJ/EcaC family oxidoreductase [Achromobacter xylosoxidans]